MSKFILILSFLCAIVWGSRIKEVLNLKEINFSFSEKISTNDSKLESANVMPMALERWQDKLFLVTPRFKIDVPVTLSYINITSKINNIIYFIKICFKK